MVARSSMAGPPAEGLPVLPPWTALVEIAVLFGLIYGLDYLTPNLAILDLSPHPFWIPVLLVSLQYGTVSGFIAAAVAIALTQFAGVPEQDIGENLFTYFLRVWGQPILWIGVALLVGQFRMRQLAAKLELRHHNEVLLRQRDDLARHSAELRGRVERLEQELVTRQVSSPHRAAAALIGVIGAGGLSDDNDCQRILEEACKPVFPDATIVIYRLQDKMLVECAVVGRKPDTGPRIRIEPNDPIYRAVIERGRRLSVLDHAGELALAGAGLVAIPIASDTLPVAFGMLVVEKADPDLLKVEGIKALELLAHAVAPRKARRMPLPATLSEEASERQLPRIAHIRMSALGGVKRRDQAQQVAPKVLKRDRRRSLVESLRHGSSDAAATVTIARLTVKDDSEGVPAVRSSGGAAGES